MRRSAGGSDWPVSSPNPLLGIHVAVNRSLPTTAGGAGNDPFLPEQSLELRIDARRVHLGQRAVNGVDDHAGSIRAGMDADLAVVDADLRTVDRRRICQATVRQTWVRGDLVHDAH